MENYTVLSGKMYHQAMRVQTVEEAVAVLKKTGQFRTMGDILRSYADTQEPRQLLVEGLMAANPGANRESMDKKVRNWLGGKTQSVSKQDAFLLSRVMGLSLDRTDAFLKLVTGEGFHWRSPEDIVWAYGIVHEMDYAGIQGLLERVNNALTLPRASESNAYTAQVRDSLQPVLSQSEDALVDYLLQEQQNLGNYHNTAHSLFMKYMRLLEYAGQEEDLDAPKKNRQEQDSRMTSRDILEKYMYRMLVPVSKRGESRDKSAFSAVQRSIRVNWPDEATISKMKKRELDVTRKVLILLFLATDGSESEYEELDEDEDILTRDEIFQNICVRLDRMLHACGFQPLDPRNFFDWMVLYCICVDDLWDVDKRLKDMLVAMFPEGTEKQE